MDLDNLLSTYFLTIMWCQDGEHRHDIDGYRLRDFGCQILSKEGDPALSFAASREKFGHVLLIGLGHEEWRCVEGTSSADTSINLMIEKLLDMVNREEMFAVHGDIDGVPDLRAKHL